jgi:uncharacterized protein
MVPQASRGPLDRADPWSQEWGRPRFNSQLEAKNKVDKKRSVERRVAALLVVVMVTALLPVGGMQPVAVASSGNALRISQVYGGGGNSGAPLTHDYIEIFNSSSSPVSLNGLSLQYASATGTGNFGANAGQLTELPDVSLEPGQYFLVQQAAGAGNGEPLPTPDYVDPTPIAMSATAGKVALVTGITSLGCNGGSTPCNAEQLARIVDLVGYGSANFYEGSGAAPTLSNTTAAFRAGGGCTDTDDNSADFTAGAPDPRNSGSPANLCGAAQDPKINEFVFNHVGTDTHEYVEVFGEPNTDYSSLAILQIEGDGTGAGVIDSLHTVGTTDAGGFWFTGFMSNVYENGTVTLLLVEGFDGYVGLDLDTNNDGVFDVTPWERIVDDVAVSDGGADDRTYSSTVLAPGFGGSLFTPGGASRIPDGADTGSPADWVLNDFDGAGLPGFSGSLGPGEALNTPGAPNEIYVAPPEACGDPFTAIYDVQGSGLTSPLVGQQVATEGIVVGDFQNNNEPDHGDLNGFYIQDPDGDGDGETSDGVFVYAPGAIDVAVGDHVRVRGTVAEYYSLTQIGNVSQVWICSFGHSITPTPISLPVGSLDDLERYEGMLVILPQTLTIAEYFNFDRYGEIVLTTERQFQPTAIYEPGSPEAAALAQANLLSRITLDDGRTSQNPDPALHPNGGSFDMDNLFRGGDTVQNVTGVLDYSYGLYRIHPTQGADYFENNPRTEQPADVGGNLKVASFNVLNYFTTIDTGAWICGPSANMECRGADTEEEFERQRTKIIAALTTMDADVVGLIEIENHLQDVPTADLVDGLNEMLGAGTYDYVATGAIGNDAIRQAFIYKPAAVSPVGAYAILDSSVDERFLDDYNRPVLAQTFMDNATGGILTVAVNHLKSKGSDCNAVGDPDLGDGAGNCNLTRMYAAMALVDWLETDPTGSGDGDFLIIGDLNAYDKEDPIDVLLAGGYTDLVHHFLGEYAYSYVFDGQLGYLDHALANADLLAQITGATVWHINADEPDLIDYDMSFKLPAQQALYAPDAYRSSDHDPVIVGLNVCDEIAPTVDVSVTPTQLWPVNHKYVWVYATVTADDNFDPNPTITLISVTSNEPDEGLGDGDMPNDIVIVDDYTFRLRAERSGLGEGRIYTVTYLVKDACGNETYATATVTVPRDMRP